MASVQRYVSKELSHFVGSGLSQQDDQFNLLVHILRQGRLTHPPHNPNESGNLRVNKDAKVSKNEMYSPQVVCFCDIPVEDLQIHTEKYSCFGLSFLKDFIARRGGAPVLYLPCSAQIRRLRNLASAGAPDGFVEDITLGDLFDHMLPEFHTMMNLFEQLIRDQAATPGNSGEHHRRFHDLFMFLEFRLFSYVKFFDHLLDDDHPQNHYMEREWRVVGNVQFRLNDIQRVIIPSTYAVRLRNEVPGFYGQITFADCR